MSFVRTLIVSSVALVTLAACGPKIRLSDSVDNVFDLRLGPQYDDRLNGPYVAGASFRVYAYDVAENVSLEGWELRTSDPGVLEIQDQWVDEDDIDEDDNSKTKSDVITAKVYAAGEGAAVIEVYDDGGSFVRGVEVEVMQPNRIEMRAAGPLFVRREGQVPSLVDDTPLLFAGGRATFLIEWYKDDLRLDGAGTLQLQSESTAIQDLWPRLTLLDEDRDWLTIETTEPSGDMVEEVPVDVLANGEYVDTVHFSSVPVENISYVELASESEAGAENGDLLVVLAQAFDESDESIWGVAFDWDIDGDNEPGEGDLFRYWYRDDARSILGAEYGSHRDEISIQGVEGFVDSSNDAIACFCSANEDRPARGVALGLLCLAGLGLIRRKLV